MPRSARHRTAARAVALLAAASLTAGLAACQTTEAASDYVTEGKLTIGTGEPAYYPYVIDDAPESGEGFEAAIAYAHKKGLDFWIEDEKPRETRKVAYSDNFRGDRAAPWTH